jgi:hypothetical protein
LRNPTRGPNMSTLCSSIWSSVIHTNTNEQTRTQMHVYATTHTPHQLRAPLSGEGHARPVRASHRLDRQHRVGIDGDHPLPKGLPPFHQIHVYAMHRANRDVHVLRGLAVDRRPEHRHLVQGKETGNTEMPAADAVRSENPREERTTSREPQAGARTTLVPSSVSGSMTKDRRQTCVNRDGQIMAPSLRWCCGSRRPRACD